MHRDNFWSIADSELSCSEIPNNLICLEIAEELFIMRKGCDRP